ncbi:F0F1 ATP synthase subunit A [Anditalea andensis]|uniref:ATP synthase subunit a n=1 Tax=Anditalea andensis TaxID=1048983 RepID=A0A074KZM2_9BACT|nr:F0F1 ATP synthase subunit A [Anditalea andensis]KEO73063.1 ATP synthase F0 subunit A [Anditalea andensis]
MIRKFLYLSILLSAVLLSSSPATYAASGSDEDRTGFIMHHIKDSHEWHFATFGDTHVSLPLPVIIYSQDRGLEVFSSRDFIDPSTHTFGKEHAGYIIDDHDHLRPVDEARSIIDLSITKNVAMMFIVIFIVLWIMLATAKNYKDRGNSAPKGIASIIEPLVIFIRDEIALPNIGARYKKFLPYLLTLFFFILIGNLLGLMPGAANLTGNISVTATLAVFTFIIVNINGNKDYWKHVFATPGVPVPLLLVIVPVEIIGLFTKPFALMVRLFVAITAGHIVILAFIALIFIFQSYAIGVVSTVMVIFINLIEILVAAIQAYVFTLFTAMYIGAAVSDHHEATEH